MNLEPATIHDISEETYVVPVIGKLSAAQYAKLKALVNDLEIRNISMRYKYIARLFHSGMLEKMVNLFKGSDTIRKRKRSDNEGLSNVKRQASDHLDPLGSNTKDIHGEAHSDCRNSGNPKPDHQASETEDQSNAKQQKNRDEGEEVLTQEPNAQSDQKRSNHELPKYTRRQAAAQTDEATNVSE